MAICRPWASELSTAIGLPVPGLEVKLVPVGRLGQGFASPRATERRPARCGCEARDPRARAERDAGLLAAGGADARGLRRRRLLLHGRRRAARRSARLSRRASCSTAGSRKTSSCRPAPGSASARCGRILAHFAPYVRDAVIAGHDRDEVGMLVVPDVDACRALCPISRPAAGRGGRRPCRRAPACARGWRRSRQRTGSATRIGRAILLTEPPSLDAGESPTRVAQSARGARPAPVARRRPVRRPAAAARDQRRGAGAMNVDELAAIDVHVHLEHDARPPTRTPRREVLRRQRRGPGRRRPSPTTTARARWRASSSRSRNGSPAGPI